MHDAFVKGQWGWTQTVASPQNVFHMKPNPLGHIDQRTGSGCHAARDSRDTLLVRIRLPAYENVVGCLVSLSCQTRGNSGQAGIELAFLVGVLLLV